MPFVAGPGPSTPAGHLSLVTLRIWLAFKKTLFLTMFSTCKDSTGKQSECAEGHRRRWGDLTPLSAWKAHVHPAALQSHRKGESGVQAA